MHFGCVKWYVKVNDTLLRCSQRSECFQMDVAHGCCICVDTTVDGKRSELNRRRRRGNRTVDVKMQFPKMTTPMRILAPTFRNFIYFFPVIPILRNPI